MKIAAFSGAYSAVSFREAATAVSRLGFEGIEIAARGQHLSPASTAGEVREVKAIADGNGLAIPVIAGYAGGFSTAGDAACRQAFEDVQRLLAMTAELGGCGLRVQPGGPNAFLAGPGHYEQAALWLDQCAKEAQTYGLQVLIELHNETLVESAGDAERLLALLGEDNIGWIHDAGNMYIADADYGADSVRQLQTRLFHVHIKDERRVAPTARAQPGEFTTHTRYGSERFVPCLLGEGEVDHGGLLDGLLEIGYKGWLTLECHAPLTAGERLAADLDTVRSLWHNRIERRRIQ
ncbi:sugar phosphate isomerase/epimerase family protein [Paenibacillus daejeonensis]|uniref:sugar phosphate isomerase/epimerase family protein n=1 Tax=Paenibacillus daejeonensis TaxID=135193 RepID=UPI00035DE85A|nr:sugar phosphate isomerase/epimerase [Paenibacillus daejeonensis]